MRLINFAGDVDKMDEFHRLHPMLQAVFFRAAEYTYTRCQGKSLLITSMFRDTGGVHRHGRGLDVDVCQCTTYEGGVSPADANFIVWAINALFRYDPTRPDMRVAIYGDLAPKGKHWNHIHFQVHDRTVSG